MIELVYKPLGLVRLNPENPKLHDDAALQASIERFGFVTAIIEDERTGFLVAGHGRIGVLRQMYAAGEPMPEGVTRDVPAHSWLVPVQTGWASKDDDEAMAFMVAANAITERGGWDDVKLANELAVLLEHGPGHAGIGFNASEITALLKRSVSYDPAPSYARTEGSHAEANLGQRLESYRNANIRSIVLDYPLADYEAVVRLAATRRVEMKMEGNAELFLAMLRAWASK